jgi:predicted permease
MSRREQRPLEKQLDDELRFDIEQRVAEKICAGMSEAAARRAVRLEFGGLEQIKEECRDARGFFDTLLQDVRYALRGMRRAPAFTIVAVATLAIGIGVNATVFSLTRAVLFRGFPMVKGSDRLVYIDTRRTAEGCCLSWPDFLDWRAQAKSFADIAAVHGEQATLNDDAASAESYDVTEVSANTFHLVGQTPIRGRDFEPADEVPGAAPVVILTYGLWERRYGRDAAIVGKTVRLNGAPATVIGVMPQGFSFPQKAELWTPVRANPERAQREAHYRLWVAVGRLRDGVSIETARAEMDTIGRRLAAAYPAADQGFRPAVNDFADFFMGHNAGVIYWTLLGAVGLVLMIACVNISNLSLARAVTRGREISLRMALGAGRWRIARQLLIESVMLSAGGGFFGWWVARLGVKIWQGMDRPWRVMDYSLNYDVLFYLIAISIVTGVLFGLAPALRLAKTDISRMLKDGGHGASAGARGKHLAGVLVSGEMALAVVLLFGAGLMIRGLATIFSLRAGIETGNILTMRLTLPPADYATPEAKIGFFDQLQKRLESVPGVESVAIANAIPTYRPSLLGYELEGVPPPEEQRRPVLPAMVIGADYFRTLGARMMAGRDFRQNDDASGVPVAIVNQLFASAHWPGEDAIGKRFRVFQGKTPGSWRTVVGVASNIAQNDTPRSDPDSQLVYLPYRQLPAPAVWVMARTRVAPESLASAFRREVQVVDVSLPVFGPWTLENRIEWTFRDITNLTRLFALFATIGLLLASVGLYAVVAHSVSQRTQEIGIRMAIGGRGPDILKMVFRQGMLPLAIGLGVGLAGSLALIPVLRSTAPVPPADPAALGGAAAVLIFAAMLGSWIPARRAMRVDPAIALRHE